MQAATLKVPIDERVSSHIRKLVGEGIRGTNEMKRHVKLFVKGLFGNNLPQFLNRRFYPSRDDIRKLIYRERKKLMEGKLDQERLKERIVEWSKEPNKIFYRASSTQHADENTEEATDSFLLVYQSDWQRRLLKKYGGEMVFLDATYRTTRYALPLFFVCVYTNCGYFIVASIITESETSASLSEAFDKLKEMNEDFRPTAFMIDASEIEMNAIRTSFPGYFMLLLQYKTE